MVGPMGALLLVADKATRGINNPSLVELMSTLAPPEGTAVPIPTSPVGMIRTCSVLFVLITNDTASVVPIKFVPAVVPAFPKSNQATLGPVANFTHTGATVVPEL